MKKTILMSSLAMLFAGNAIAAPVTTESVTQPTVKWEITAEKKDDVSILVARTGAETVHFSANNADGFTTKQLPFEIQINSGNNDSVSVDAQLVSDTIINSAAAAATMTVKVKAGSLALTKNTWTNLINSKTGYTSSGITPLAAINGNTTGAFTAELTDFTNISGASVDFAGLPVGTYGGDVVVKFKATWEKTE